MLPDPHDGETSWIQVRMEDADPDPQGKYRQKSAENLRIFKKILFKLKIYFITSNTVKVSKQII